MEDKMYIEIEKLDYVADVVLIHPKYGGGPVVAIFTEVEHGADFFTKAEEYARKVALDEGGLEVKVLCSD